MNPRYAALAAFLALRAFAAEDPGELYRRGLQLFAQRQPEAAIDAFRRSLALRPGDAATWKALGVVHAAGGDYRNAEEPFHRACLLNAREPDACLYFGRTLYLLDRFQTALDVLREAQQNDPQNAQIFRIEGLALEALGKIDEAIAALQLAIRLDRNPGGNDDPAIDYGVLLFRQGRAVEAIVPLQTAIDRRPDAARAQLELGCVLLALDRIPEAAAHLERAAALDPATPRGHLLLGKAYLRLGKTELAQKELDQGSRTVK